MIFKTKRLYTREWRFDDIDDLLKMNSNHDVMKFFPDIQDRAHCENFIVNMIDHFDKKAYSYLPCFQLLDNRFIGWVGLKDQDLLGKQFTDIGWRILPEFWGKGYASEMATAFLSFGFEKMELTEIFAIAPKANIPSIGVMKKIGMKFQYDFKHPKLGNHEDIETCEMYKITSK